MPAERRSLLLRVRTPLCERSRSSEEYPSRSATVEAMPSSLPIQFRGDPTPSPTTRARVRELLDDLRAATRHARRCGPVGETTKCITKCVFAWAYAQRFVARAERWLPPSFVS